LWAVRPHSLPSDSSVLFAHLFRVKTELGSLTPPGMARDSRDTVIPTLYQLQQPEKLGSVLEKDKSDDCLSCRLIGRLTLQ